jgi:alpha-L-rhamnosidase
MSNISKLKPIDLECEYLKNPLGVDIGNPRLSWVLKSDKFGQKQTAYRIIVSSSKTLLAKDKGNLWDTKKVSSNDCNQIVYNGEKLSSKLFCYWKVMVWDIDDMPSEWSNISYWSMGIMNKEEWKAKWIGESPRRRALFFRNWLFHDYDPSPFLRKEFSVKDKPQRAIIYVSALGDYELQLNGKKVGNRLLAPEWTDYNQRIQYQTYDLTNKLVKGDNAIGIILGDGWFKGNLGPFGLLHNYYGVNRRCLAQLHIKYHDGTTATICSDEDWKKYENGPIRRSDHFKGEIYDTQKEIPGWNKINFNDSKWEPVFVYEKPKAQLVAQMNEPIRIIKQIKAKKITEPEKGIYIFDLGQNISGWCEIKINLAPIEDKAELQLKYGERLNQDGSLFRANLGLAKNEDVYYINKGRTYTLHPHFTYRGFRYVEVKGLKAEFNPELGMVTGYAIASDCRKSFEFDSSSENLNQLMKNILWTQRNNLISIPTDCPQRAERMGWMGDTTCYAQTSMFIMDMSAFYSKWIKDIRDAQDNSGRYPDFVPYPRNKIYKLLNFYCAPGWADCGVILPWLMYLNYGDKRILNQHYQSAKTFIDHIHEVNPDLIWTNSIGNNYADWLNGDTLKLEEYPEEGATIPSEVFATAFFAYSTQILSKMAKIIGKKKDALEYLKLAEKIKITFYETFFDKNLRIKGDSQSGYALALHFDLVPKKSRKKVLQNLIANIQHYDNRLSTGFIATIPLMLELVKEGYQDLAFELLFSEKCPSWFFMVNQGATTMWERWDGYMEERGIHSKRMNSFNHFAFGAIAEFIYKIILGINYDQEHPGYRHIIIKPYLTRKLKWINGAYYSKYGKIQVKWKLTKKRATLSISIPPNTTATLKLSISESTKIKENGKELSESEYIKDVEYGEQEVHFKIESGIYEFLIENVVI